MDFGIQILFDFKIFFENKRKIIMFFDEKVNASEKEFSLRIYFTPL